MSAVALIQARMTSSRFPGKVLRLLAGRPLLWHIAQRVARSRSVERVVVACSDRSEDDAIADFCAAENLACVRGSETNVLDRFRVARGLFPADIYVRICGDSPLVSSAWVDRCVAAVQAAKADYSVVEPGRRCVHEGVDVLSARALDALLTRAADDPVAREHVTGYFQTNPAFALAAPVSVEPGEEGRARFSVDVPEDLEFFERLYATVGVPAGELTVTQALQALASHPELRRINAGVQQRLADERPAKVFLYGEGGGAVGWGHLSRLAVVACSLRRAGADVIVGHEGGAEGAAFLHEQRLHGRIFPGGTSRGEWLARELAKARSEVVMIDTCGRFTADDLRQMRRSIRGVSVLLLDDISDRVKHADAVYNPPAPQALAVPSGYAGVWHAGWNCVPLRGDFLAAARPPTGHTLLVTMGGSDPRNFTLRALQALSRVRGIAAWTVRVVLGPSYPFREELARKLGQMALRVEVVEATREMAREMIAARAVLLSFGVTAYEAAALGRPMACFCLSPDHRLHASAFVQEGHAITLDDHPGTDVAILQGWLDALPERAHARSLDLLREGTAWLTKEILAWTKRRPPPAVAA